MNKAALLDLFANFDLSAQRKAVKEFLENKNNSFDDRKEIFMATPEPLYNKGLWILHLPSFEKKHGEISWFDDFYADRYTDVDLRAVVDDIDDQDDWSDEKRQDFVTAVVNNGMHSFNLDW